MHKVFLFGSRALGVIPDVIQNHISEIIKQTNGDVEFIIGDAGGVDSGFHQTLSALGGRRMTKVYCMDNPRNNKFDLETYIFKTTYDLDKKEIKIYDPSGIELDSIDGVLKAEDIKNTRQYYEFKDKQMCRDCTFAICYWDGQSKGTLRNIDRLKAQDKYVYVYTAQIG